MARRRDESGLDLLLAAPWWVSAAVGVLGFVAFHWIIPAATLNSPILKGLGQSLTPIGYFVGAICGLIALINFFRQRNSQPRSQDFSLNPPLTPAPTVIPKSDAVSEAWEYLKRAAKSKQTVSKPTEWSLELLRRIEWKRFEELSAAFYREIGLRSETIRCGADGGIDAKLFQGDSQEPIAVVQCKAWNTRPVGVKPVRELLGVMTHQNIGKGIFITTGNYTNEAAQFAKANPIDLVNGTTFLGMIRKLSEDARHRLLAVATEGEFTTPTCPSCGIKMVWRNSERGDFWGCSSYPRCKQRFFMKIESA